MTYDQWKTTDPADCAPTCGRCGSYLRGFLGRYECDVCSDELMAEEAMMDFYHWEPEAPHAGRDGAVASACERVATSNSPLPDAPKQEK